jgi:predicted nucleotidyltransferase
MAADDTYTVLFPPELAACPKRLIALIEEIAREPATTAVWLFGSRANGTATTQSDWDILVFRAEETKPVASRCEGLDVLRVDPSGNALLEGKPEDLIQPFSRFKWSRTGSREASYTGQRFRVDVGPRDCFEPPVIQFPCRAILIYEKKG